ncbi:uncharacterized protein LOC26529171 [Drosophila willistoni]|uniref:uncharacterized protein LOC26529171 n=1 Tax=Drosophila willistoni TaxID=7260 RepID=UPI001F071E34|nr:uncharacterized protein LOC26529171 [Drosophila willistoni]
MSQRQGDPLFHVTLCNLCMEKATNFLTGLCIRCHLIWTNKRRSEDRICLNLVKAYIVARVTQTDVISPNMDPTFRQVLDSEATKRREKLQSFHQLRDKFQNSLVIDAFERANPHNCGNRCCKAPLVLTGNDFANSQYEMDLLKDIKNYEKSLPNQTDLNSKYFNTF